MTPGRWWGAARLALGLTLLALVVARTGGLALVPRLGSAPWLVALFTVQAGLGVLVEAARLRLLLRSQQLDLPLARALRLCVVAIPFGYLVPGGVGGDVMKVAALAGERRGRGVELAAVVLVDRITGLTALLSVALLAALVTGNAAAAPAPLRGALVAAAAGLAFLGTGAALVWTPAVRAGGAYRFLTTRAPLHAITARVFDAFLAFRDHRGAVAGAVLMTAAGHALLAGFFIAASRVVMDAVPAATVAWVSLLALVANVLPLTPGGLGVGEAAFAAAFGLLGHAGGAQLLILVRIGVVPFAILGALVYALGRHGAAAAPPAAETGRG